MQSCVMAYKDLCGEPDMKLRSVETPCIASREEAGGEAGGGMLPRRGPRANPLVPFSPSQAPC